MEIPQGLQPNISYRHFDLAGNFPVIGLLGDTWTQSPEKFSRMHFHNCLEIGFLFVGSAKLHINDRIVSCQAPCVTIVPPNVPHITLSDEDSVCHWKWLYVDPLQLLPDLNPRLTNEIDQYQHTLAGEDCVISTARESKVYTLVEMIIDEMENNLPNHHAVVRELFHTLFLVLLRIHRTVQLGELYTNNRLGCISPAITYITNNYMNDLTVEDLAQLCHVSTSHFRRLFKQVLGWSPQEYLQLVRIERACTLLYNDDSSITEIGLQVGYPSPSSFSRQFKRIYNMSPSRWRQKMQREENPQVTAYFDALPPSHRQFFPESYTMEDSDDE